MKSRDIIRIKTKLVYITSYLKKKQMTLEEEACTKIMVKACKTLIFFYQQKTIIFFISKNE